MLVTLLFIAQVGCEWVQISQQHYRKPYRHYNHPVLAEEGDFEYEEDTTPKTNMYTNQSVNDYKWKASDIPYKKGFVTKVEGDDYIIRGDKKTDFNKMNNDKYKELERDAFRSNIHGQHKPTKVPIGNEEAVILTKKPHSDKQNAESHTNFKLYGPDISASVEDIFEESYQVIPNIGSIKKVHLDSRTVRTSILNEISRKQHGTSSSHNINPPVSERGPFLSRPAIIWKSDDQTKKVVPGMIEKVSKEDLKRRPIENISRYEEIPLNEDHSKIREIFMTHIVQSSGGMSGESVKLNHLPDINFEKPVFVTKEEFDDDGLVTISTDDDTAASAEKTTESSKKPTTDTPKVKIENKTEDLPTKDKVNTMDNILKFMRIVTDTISRNTRRSVGSKVRYLENLQDTIMANIEHRINTLWPDDQLPDKPSRKTRSAATPRGEGHMDFPSSESALMTISFLTFAVYLIKLVLQVIHTYKNKAMLMTPTVVTTVGRTVAAVFRRTEVP